MIVTFEEGRLFYELYAALLSFVNQRLRVIPEQFADMVQYLAVPAESRAAVRDALFTHRELLDQFVEENPARLSADDLAIVASWKHALVGNFYVFRYLANYTVFLSSSHSPNKAYGVLGLADPIQTVVSPCLPRAVKAVLLPFNGEIIYDGLIGVYGITFGGGFRRMLDEEYRRAKRAFGIITSLPFDDGQREAKEKGEAVIVTYDRSGKSHKTRIGGKGKASVPLNLTHAQRKALADVLPSLADRLKTGAAASRTIRFTDDEVRDITTKCQAAMHEASNGMLRNSLRHVIDAAQRAVENSQGIALIPASERLYQFKITLKGIKPPIWRRIQTKDCTLDRLHEHIQTAMGWTNSHLHQFKIGGVVHGDPQLLCEGGEDERPINSRRKKISKIVPADGKRFSFDYEYDFGDGWEHEVLFEGCLRAEKGARYPLCVEGERACPPEDVGGICGYQDYLEAMADPKHEQHKDFVEWRGPFDSEEFDAVAATREMRRGLPDWREME